MDIRFEDAEVRFAGRTVLLPVRLDLTERRIGIIGLNGSGKTTFARLINGLVRPSKGRILVDGLDVTAEPDAVRRQVGYIFQNPQNQIILPIVRDDIALGLKNSRLPKGEIEFRVQAMLERLSIGELGGRRAHELSGGELQLAALAAILVTEPRLLILDEPTNQLDLRNRNRVLQTITSLPQQLIVITHDLGLLDGFDRVLLFDQGRLVGDGVPADVIAQYEALAA
ncbi:energy-coupling factor ABC transporter ATP-binding protein [Rhizobium oryzicola]|uniref:Energy-coupling factor ABC transporter ATP-binding protein n=1 Tax=Rhizobium oryzicola TaxID=1232668 RepID=A0ABT8SS85_9HYPH|nr:energy-coupling factor ABC transporter ATP-binding protein [Rhizobium oryzicola]MDO1581280.1 energy-coupling factor ABC transporter ATP-binding protein [Rhizobium oryzicola]